MTKELYNKRKELIKKWKESGYLNGFAIWKNNPLECENNNQIYVNVDKIEIINKLHYIIKKADEMFKMNILPIYHLNGELYIYEIFHCLMLKIKKQSIF